MPRSKAPTTAEHRTLCGVRDRLEKQLSPTVGRDWPEDPPTDDELKIEGVVGQFLLGFEVGRPSDLNVAALNERYVRALVGRPLAAIQAAIDRFDRCEPLIPRAKSGWNPAFRPTTAQLSDEVAEGMIGVRAHLVHVRRILAAEVYDPPTAEQKAAADALMQAAVAGFKREPRAAPAASKPLVPQAPIAVSEEAWGRLNARQDEAARLAALYRPGGV